MSISLPPKPSLEQLKKQAKDLLKAQRNGDPSACEALKLTHRFIESTEEEILLSSVTLVEAQFALALAYGFEDWRALKAHVESTGKADTVPEETNGESGSEVDVAETVDKGDAPVIQLVNKIILDAYAREVSDIHIEPYPGMNDTEIRMRVDGQMYLYESIPYNYRNAVTSRIKVMSDLDTNERRLPQEGTIKFRKYGGKDVELRVSTVPTQGGLETVTLRILAAGEPIPLNRMGFTEENYTGFVSCITKPHGLILVCGPTGAGKTTTLHSALGYINTPNRKIWTAEDPVEITQKGLSQVQVTPSIGYDYPAALRSFLRSDPDVIMVGELRDKETTQMCIEAALTGHLVLSTLHSSGSPEGVTRLLDIGMDHFNLSDAILCVLSQRLVRTLCCSCKNPYSLTEEEYNDLVREYGAGDFEKNLDIPYTDDLSVSRANGCPDCNETGYRGRMALHELLIDTDAMKRLIRTGATMEEIQAQAKKDGMTTVKQDGIGKVFAGDCDLLQVRNVCI